MDQFDKALAETACEGLGRVGYDVSLIKEILDNAFHDLGVP